MTAEKRANQDTIPVLVAGKVGELAFRTAIVTAGAVQVAFEGILKHAPGNANQQETDMLLVDKEIH